MNIFLKIKCSRRIATLISPRTTYFTTHSAIHINKNKDVPLIFGKICVRWSRRRAYRGSQVEKLFSAMPPLGRLDLSPGSCAIFSNYKLSHLPWAWERQIQLHTYCGKIRPILFHHGNCTGHGVGMECLCHQ